MPVNTRLGALLNYALIVLNAIVGFLYTHLICRTNLGKVSTDYIHL